MGSTLTAVAVSLTTTSVPLGFSASALIEQGSDGQEDGQYPLPGPGSLIHRLLLSG